MKTRLREVRVAQGLSTPEVARLSNTFSPLVYRLEAGREKAGPTVRGRLAAALGLPETALFDSAGWPLQAEVEP